MRQLRAAISSAIFFCLFSPLQGTAWGADWPAKQPIKLIVPSAAGSAPDFVSRKVATFLAERLGQAVVVDNKPGASGAIGMQALAASRPDGYTFGYGNVATLAINPHLFSKLPYDARKDFNPVIAFTSIPNVLVVRADLPVSTLREFIAYAKANPSKLAMASGGTGTTSHLSGELLKVKTGMSYVHVPYQNSTQGVAELMGGTVDFMVENLSTVIGAVQSGKARALAITSKSRSLILTEVPTMDEAGLPDFEVSAWGGFIAPAGTPQAIIDRLNREINGLAALPAAKSEFAQFSATLLGGSPEVFSQLITDESKLWGDIIRKNGIRPD